MATTSPWAICSTRHANRPSISNASKPAKPANGVRAANQTNTHNAVQAFCERVSCGPANMRGNHQRESAMAIAAMASRMSAAAIQGPGSGRSPVQVSNSAVALRISIGSARKASRQKNGSRMLGLRANSSPAYKACRFSAKRSLSCSALTESRRYCFNSPSSSLKFDVSSSRSLAMSSDSGGASLAGAGPSCLSRSSSSRTRGSRSSIFVRIVSMAVLSDCRRPASVSAVTSSRAIVASISSSDVLIESTGLASAASAHAVPANAGIASSKAPTKPQQANRRAIASQQCLSVMRPAPFGGRSRAHPAKSQDAGPSQRRNKRPRAVNPYRPSRCG